MTVLHGHLGPCAAHAGAWLQLLEDLMRKLAACLQFLGGVAECLQLVGAIEGAPCSRRLGRRAEAQVARAVVRPIEQVIDFGDV